MIEIRHRPAVESLSGVRWPEVWGVECCTRLAAEPTGDPTAAPRSAPITCRSEVDAIRVLVAHLADEHGVMVVREIIVQDVTPCTGPSWANACIAEFIDDDLRCPCDGLGEIHTARTVTVDQHTVEPAS